MTATDSFDADRLDAWLEGNPFPSMSLNGHSDAQSDLVGTAQRFHAGIGAAERGMPVPARVIWEDVMQRTADLKISPPVIAATNGSGVPRTPVASRRPTMESPHRRGYWFTTASLIVIAVFAIVAVAFLANRPSNGGDEVPGLGISAFTPIAGSSVIASPAASNPSAMPFTILDPEKIDCSEVVRRSNEEIASLQANPGEFPDRSYGPAVPADPENASLVSVTDQYVNACRSEWRTLASPRLIADVQSTGYPAGLFPGYYLDQGMTMEELSLFLQSLLAVVGVDQADDVIIPTDAFGEEAALIPVINPNHTYLFPDGRIGAPQSQIFATQYATGRTAVRTQFVFYIQDPTQDGKWVLDETLPICIGECDEFWTAIADGTLYAPISNAIPGATPEASAEDIDRWLVHPDDMDCLRADPDPLTDVPTVARAPMYPGDYLPFTTASSEDQIAIATRTQNLIAVCDLGDEPLISDDFSYFDSPYGDPVTQQQLDTARAISDAVATDDLTDYIIVADEPRPTNLDGDLYSFSRRTLLPESIVLLPDGRLGGPLTAIIPSSEDRATIGDYIAERGQIETNFIIFERQGNTWILDESITLCLGDCDDWWTMYEIANEPAIGTPEASPSADVGVERWLVPPSSIDCGTPVANDLNSNEWSTDLVIDTDAYLPFSEPPTDQQEAIAETALLGFSDCVNTAMLSDDFAWMPGIPGIRPTADQIAAAQKISVALPDQDPASYFIVRPSDDPDYRGRTVLLPDDVVMLADGRLGAPYRYFATMQGDANWTRSQMGDGTFAMVPFLTFERSGDTWLLDEVFMVCVGECDQAWQAMANGTNLDGTPEPLTISPASFDAITADDCPPAPTGFAGPFNAPRYDTGENPYVVAGLPGVDILGNVTDSVRGWRGCQLAEEETGQQALQTARFTEDGGTIQDPRFPELPDPLDRQITATNFQENRQNLTDMMLDGEWHDFNVTTPYMAADETYLTPLGNRAMVLADSRIAVPLMTIWPESAQYVEANNPYWFVPVDILIWSTEADRWLVDESFLLCAGDCDQYLRELDTTVGIRMATETPPALLPTTPESEATSVDPGFVIPPPDSTYTDDGFKHPQGTPGIESTSVVVLPPVEGTPADSDGTPVASPTTGNERWLADTESVDCTRLEEDLFGVIQRVPMRGESWDYLPVQPAAGADSIAVAESFQLIGAGCDPDSLGYPLISNPITVFPQVVDDTPMATSNQVALAKLLSRSLPITPGMVYLEGEPLADLEFESSEPRFTTNPVLLPDNVVVLPDGRLGAPLTWYIQTNHPEGLEGLLEYLGENDVSPALIFMIFTMEDGHAVLDEMLQLCTGNCDDYWASIQIVDTIEASTPETVASPAADLAYEPITAEECNVDGLTTDEVSAIIRNPGEQPERSYVPVGPADPADAEAAIAADRAWYACTAHGSMGQKAALQSPWLTSTGPESDILVDTMSETIELINNRKPLSERMLIGNRMDFTVPAGMTQNEMIADLMASSFTIPASSGAMLLEDGRIAIPQITVEADDSYIFDEEWSPPAPYFATRVHIMAFDTATGGWLVDEVIWLCGGDCDQMISDLQEQEAAWLEQAGVPPATPEATPAAGS